MAISWVFHSFPVMNGDYQRPFRSSESYFKSQPLSDHLWRTTRSRMIHIYMENQSPAPGSLTKTSLENLWKIYGKSMKNLWIIIPPSLESSPDGSLSSYSLIAVVWGHGFRWFTKSHGKGAPRAPLGDGSTGTSLGWYLRCEINGAGWC